MNVQKIINVVKTLSGGNSKVVDAAQKAISESRNYQPTLEGAIQIAQKFGIDAQVLAGMKSHLNNPVVKMGLNTIAPGSIAKISEMGDQLESALRQNGASTGQSPQSSGMPTIQNDELAKRLKKLGIN